MRSWITRTLVVLSVVMVLYIAGPSPKQPVYNIALPNVPTAAALPAFVQQMEAQHKLKPNNEARIVWYNDSLQQPTEYALV